MFTFAMSISIQWNPGLYNGHHRDQQTCPFNRAQVLELMFFDNVIPVIECGCVHYDCVHCGCVHCGCVHCDCVHCDRHCVIFVIHSWDTSQELTRSEKNVSK